MTAFKHPTLKPPHAGLYMRDWRGTTVQPENERALHVDLWLTSDDELLEPGVWYVMPNWNDTGYEALPWRELTADELFKFAEQHKLEFYEAIREIRRCS